MKTLTVWQPWAALIVELCKPWEFRGWQPPKSIIGERIVIHAAARKVDRYEVDDLIFRLRAGGIDAASTCLQPVDRALEILGRGDFQLGCGLGTAIVGRPRNGNDIAAELGLLRANDSDRDAHANWGWPMLEVEKWAEPIAMRGAQGLWNWPQPEWAS